MIQLVLENASHNASQKRFVFDSTAVHRFIANHVANTVTVHLGER